MKGEPPVIMDIQDTDADSFLRNWSARAFDYVQLAMIAEVEKQLVKYAMEAWRPMSIEPPIDVPLLCSCEDGVVLMTQNSFAEWRTSAGLPHKPPLAWMPCPLPEPRV